MTVLKQHFIQNTTHNRGHMQKTKKNKFLYEILYIETICK